MQFPIIAPFAKSLGATPALTGIIVGIYSLTNMTGNLVAGIALDKWGRKFPLGAGLLITALALLGYVFAASPSQLLIARALHGLSAAVLAPGAFALLGDLTRSRNIMTSMGINSLPIAIAAVVGPLLSVWLSEIAGYSFVFLLSSLLMLVVFVGFVYFATQTPTIKKSGGDSPSNNEKYKADFGRMFSAYFAALAMTVGFGALVTNFPNWIINEVGSSSASGIGFAILSLFGMATMVSPLMSRGYASTRIVPLTFGLGIIGLGLILLTTLTGIWGAMASMAVFGIGFGMLFPTMKTILTEATSIHTRGRAFGVFYAIYSLGVVVGSTGSGVILDIQGDASAGPFLFGATASLIAIPIAISIEMLRKHNSKDRY
jgi:MFS family permease